jgi:hypothetical protein
MGEAGDPDKDSLTQLPVSEESSIKKSTIPKEQQEIVANLILVYEVNKDRRYRENDKYAAIKFGLDQVFHNVNLNWAGWNEADQLGDEACEDLVKELIERTVKCLKPE